jgi:Sap, sulfolipid-1-addressing protein
VGDLFVELVPLAVVCALSPWAIVAVILMLASDRPSNSVVWLAGWTLSTLAIGVLVVVFLGGYDFSRNSTPTTVACVVQVLLSVVLLLAAGRFWARRPARTGKLPKEPGWMTRIGKMSPVLAFLIGAFWINTTVVIAAGVDTLRAALSSEESIVVFAAFTLITVSVQGGLILYAYVLPKRATIGLDRIRDGIARNQEAALSVVAFVLAVWFASQGLRGLVA